ncbi:hypothetical protein GCM10023321_50450 [Pseudonocardia eucalypti]|uniref:Uncharacterized protein n=1 Tax=Pseudonocardia eucalypti TaxID=648755 RepID=A0ABP9QKS4_9PSEU
MVNGSSRRVASSGNSPSAERQNHGVPWWPGAALSSTQFADRIHRCSEAIAVSTATASARTGSGVRLGPSKRSRAASNSRRAVSRAFHASSRRLACRRVRTCVNASSARSRACIAG